MRIEVTEQTKIERPAWEVRDQFRDITYHAANAVHRAQRVAVLNRDNGRCRYTLTTRIGPRVGRAEVVMAESAHGALVNEITSGPFAGSIVTFEFEWTGPSETVVVAAASVDVRGAARIGRWWLRRWVRRTLTTILEEDRVDLESGAYARAGRRYAHPSLA